MPGESARLENLRRQLLDLYTCQGYLQTSPPFVEFAELLHNSGPANHNLLECTDPLTGRRLALRGDGTAQVARVRSVQMADTPDPVRLCYCLPVVQSRVESLDSPRFFYQVGAELFGASDSRADGEILSLMVQSLQEAGIGEIIVSLGHTGFFSALMDSAGADKEVTAQLLGLLQRRALPEIEAVARQVGLDDGITQLLKTLAGAHGEIDQLEQLTEPFTHLRGVPEAVQELRQIAGALPAECKPLFDLGDVYRKHYHSGLVFACFTPSHGAAVARGGRYLTDSGTSAVGFSANLWLLAALSNKGLSSKDLSNEEAAPAKLVFAPADTDGALKAEIDRLRAAGTAVVQGFADTPGPLPGCTHRLERQGDGWQLKPLD